MCPCRVYLCKEDFQSLCARHVLAAGVAAAAAGSAEPATVSAAFPEPCIIQGTPYLLKCTICCGTVSGLEVEGNQVGSVPYCNPRRGRGTPMTFVGAPRDYTARFLVVTAAALLTGITVVTALFFIRRDNKYLLAALVMSLAFMCVWWFAVRHPRFYLWTSQCTHRAVPTEDRASNMEATIHNAELPGVTVVPYDNQEGAQPPVAVREATIGRSATPAAALSQTTHNHSHPLAS